MDLGWLRIVGLAPLLMSAEMAMAAPPPVLDFNTIIRDEHHSGDCAVTFDDGPGEHTGVLLDVLAAHHVPATFFVLGEHVRRYPDFIRRMVADGHDVENHSYDHPDMRKLDEAARYKEIEDTEKLLLALGAHPQYFRPPYGSYDANLITEARREGLEVVLWSHDSLDWRYHSVADMEGHVMPVSTKGGAHGVFLFHDIHDSTIAAIPAILDALKSSGCHFVTMTQWMGDNVK